MLKISKPLSSDHIASYFKTEFGAADQSNYHSVGGAVQGEWHGTLARQFGLVGSVDEAKYQRLANGQHPDSGIQLIKHRLPAPEPKQWEPKWLTDDSAWEEHVKNLFAIGERMQMPEDMREFMQEVDPIEIEAEPETTAKKERPQKNPMTHIAAWDFTFGAPKTYSATALVGGDAGLIADHKAAVRIAVDAMERYVQARLGGKKMPITTENLAAALFLHDTSRPVGSQAPNPHLHTHAVVFNMTDGAGKIRSIQPYEMYRIQSYGTAVYQAEIAYRATERGYELEHGRNYSTQIKGYSKEYLDAISARTAEIEAEKERLGLVGAEADERVNKRLRKPKQEWAPEALKAEHRRQAEEFGQSPERIAQEAHQREARTLTPAERVKLAHHAIDHARDRLFEHQAVNDHFELMRDALRAGMGHLRLQDVEQAFAQRQEFVRVGHYRENAPGARYTTKAMQTMERQSIELMLAGKGSTPPISPDLTRDQFRERYKARDVDGREIHLNDSQMWMAYRVLTEPHQFMIIRGAAGTGKTTALEPIAEIAGEVALFHKAAGYEIIGLAAASGAANNLKTLGIDSRTMQAHNLAPVDPTDKKRLYIVDEGSLIGTQQFYRFVKSVRPEDRVIIAYDPRQHQAVEAGRIVEEMEQAGVRALTLEKIVRQQNNPELLAVVNLWKEGQITEGLKKLDEMAHVWQVANRKQRFQAMAEWYAGHADTLMVAPDNRSIAELNAAARVELRKLGKLGTDVYEATILVGSRDVREADRKLAVMYEPGNVVRWGKGVAMLGVKSGDYTPVVRVDTAANLVTIDVYGQEKTYNPRHAYGVEIYNAERRKLAVGERIQVTRPWRLNKNERIPNRAMATIKSIDAKGRGDLEFEGGRKVRWDARNMPHVDYSYAMTSYSLQYATAQNVLLHLDTGDSRIRSLMDKSLVYVGGSRAAETLHVFTDSRETLLGENSPANRQAIKPKALSAEEIREYGYAASMAS